MSNTTAPASDLVKQTLRTVIVLVTACVLFVGALSGAAVAMTSRAFGSGNAAESTSEPAPVKAAKAEKTETTPAKKPQSI